MSEFENHIAALFRLGKEFAGNRYSGDVNYLAIIESIKYPTRFPNQKLRLYDNLASYKSFLKKAFYSQSGSRVFESNLVNRIMDHNYEPTDYFKELPFIPLENLANYLSSPVEYDMTFFNLRNACSIKLKDSNDRMYEDEAIKLSRQHYQKFADADDLGELIRMSSPGSGLYHINKAILEYFFEDYEALEEWLPLAPKVYKFDKKYLEFKDFLIAFKSNNLNPIKYDFLEIAPPSYT